MDGQSNVIDWSEALQQCGDDEEFLREVLVDLRTETETQLTNIAGIIQVCIFFTWFSTECWFSICGAPPVFFSLTITCLSLASIFRFLHKNI